VAIPLLTLNDRWVTNGLVSVGFHLTERFPNVGTVFVSALAVHFVLLLFTILIYNIILHEKLTGVYVATYAGSQANPVLWNNHETEQEVFFIFI